MPPPRADFDAIRVVTWNILVGVEEGAPWRRHGWSIRKDAIRAALAGTMPDILCVQEALDAQAREIAGMLPGHHRVGVGRDDGRSGGEHCAIYFDGGRFEELGSGTFWLEEPADEPPLGTAFGPKRICTWVRLRDRRTARCFPPLQPPPVPHGFGPAGCGPTDPGTDRRGDAAEPVLVTGDFNAEPDAPCRRLFDEAGLRPARSLPGCLRASPPISSTGSASAASMKSSSIEAGGSPLAACST